MKRRYRDIADLHGKKERCNNEEEVENLFEIQAENDERKSVDKDELMAKDLFSDEFMAKDLLSEALVTILNKRGSNKTC